MMSLVKEGGSMTYQVPVLSTPTNYLVWAVKVKSIMDAHDIWETMKHRIKKNSKQALAFFVSSDTRRHGVASGELHRTKESVGWAENTVFGSGSGENGSTCNVKERA
uniref:DUF4219 domain-containing protein n=1 Tax=Lactuca sativa TaxID=4236 RepID=A0A9R1VN18_LACSA|nr:hypothetical protein LSAT_V11C500274510 [Lactuca sativa]